MKPIAIVIAFASALLAVSSISSADACRRFLC